MKRKEEAGLAITAAVRCLVRFWKENGAFLDFEIEGPGISDEWVTAYVGGCLLTGGRQTEPEEAGVLEEAVRFLKKRRREDGGWGFNRFCGTDSDSTANAVLFFAGMGEPVPESCFTCLKGFQKDDGGFSTYLKGTKASWEISHADVTARVLLALSYGGSMEEAAGRAQPYLEKQLFSSCLPPAYWWNSEYYTALAICRWFERRGLPFPRQAAAEECLKRELPETAFDLALLAELLIKLACRKKEIDPVIEALLSLEKADGSFPGSGILRVTRAGCTEPWNGEGGYVSISDQNVFTTAEALRALRSYSLAWEEGRIKE